MRVAPSSVQNRCCDSYRVPHWGQSFVSLTVNSMSLAGVMGQVFWYWVILIRHSREGGNPFQEKMHYRFRGNDQTDQLSELF